MQVRSGNLTPLGARGIALLCAAVFVASAHIAQAGINVWTSHGPGTAVIGTLALDPTTPNTIYAGGADGVAFKSTDGGGSWSGASTGLPGGSFVSVTALAIDPATPTTLYAGLGYSGGRISSGGVFKSTDDGRSWQATDIGLPRNFNSVYSLAIDPATPGTLYAVTGHFLQGGGAIFKSTDAGETWSAASTGLPTFDRAALAIDPATPTTLYVGTNDNAGEDPSGGVYKSTDGGGSWQAVNADLYVYRLAIDATTPNTLYAGTYYGVFKSTDGASSWQAVNAGLPNDAVVALAIDPITPNTLYAGGYFGVFKSTDGGGSWQAVDAGLSNSYVTALALDPSTPGRLYASTFAGVFDIEQLLPSCVGDCSGTSAVAINDLITLVNIALGTGPPAACADGGLPLGGDVDIAVLIQAVKNALNGCVVVPNRAPRAGGTRP